MTKPRLAIAAIAAAVLLSSCSFDGIESMSLPGGKGKGAGSWALTVELPDVGTLTPNSQVKVGDVAVGTVTAIKAVDWHAEAALSLEKDVTLPADAVARVGINSLLGSSYVELAPPVTGGTGRLARGARIPLSRGEAYPATEQVLASASVVLNGSGLEQLSTITRELNNALSGNDLAVRDLLPRLDSFVGILDQQRGEIVGAINDVDRLSRRFARNRGTLTRALDELGPALRTLSEERPHLTSALRSLHQLGDVAVPLVRSAKDDLVADLRDIVPALQAMAQAGDSVVKGIGFGLTFPFPPETVARACVSDYCNLFATIAITSDALLKGFLGPDGKLGIPGIPGLPAGLLGLLPGLGIPGLGGTALLGNGDGLLSSLNLFPTEGTAP